VRAADARPGRKRVSSRAMLEEAACELFLEQTYAGTTVEQIAQRAGVSRNTFFNYFDAKSDVLWAGVDDSTERLSEQLAAELPHTPPMRAVRNAFLRTAAALSPGAIPLAITQWHAMGVAAELQSSGLPRFLRMASVVERFLNERTGLDAVGRFPAQPAAFAVVAAAVAASGVWARAGVARRELQSYVAEAIDPICDGFEA
jgi:AcrR family transcriptional regulator